MARVGVPWLCQERAPALLPPDAGADTEMVLQEVTARLQSRFGFALCTVQVEQHREETAGCPHCQDPRT